MYIKFENLLIADSTNRIRLVLSAMDRFDPILRTEHSIQYYDDFSKGYTLTPITSRHIKTVSYSNFELDMSNTLKLRNLCVYYYKSLYSLSDDPTQLRFLQKLKNN